jgi:hypothetical protein
MYSIYLYVLLARGWGMGRVMRLVYERVWQTDHGVLVGLYPAKPAQRS